MAKLTVKDIDLKDKKVIMRVDFNVPCDKRGKITDETRIKEALPTIKYVLKHAKKLILMSHLGRPDGKIVESLRLTEVAKKLSKLLKKPVEKLDDCVGEDIKKKIEKTPKKIILLENLRFHPQEEKGDENFAKELASLADVYVNDAFGTAHRAHASTTIIAKYLPSCIGFLMEKELNSLSCALAPTKPYVVILGGAKVSDKIGLIKNLLNKADKILIGGAMAYTFLKAKGITVGKSKIEEDKLSLAEQLLEEAKNKNVQILLPVDHLAVDNIDEPKIKIITENESIDDNLIGVDIGPKTISLFKKALKDANTVLWNGPLGIFENNAYAKGTKEIALYLAKLKKAMTIVGGGDSAAAAKKFGVAKKLCHVSTGGGASLEFLEGKELPGIMIIPDKK
ncbi:MAG: phosphoglycerate kinase [Candidatus Omnitrophica bacterium]|nr:phosphoglycerate kinase [Candidatus Omnitrophota bacterium]